MSNKNLPNEFAYGYDTEMGCACPAVVAGYSPSSGDKTTAVAEHYDEIIRSRDGVAELNGVVDAEMAREAWLQIIQRLPEGDFERQIAEEVAEVLGWL